MMRKRIAALFLAVCIIFSVTAMDYMTAHAEGESSEKTIKVLFVGNSFTKYNNLHKIFKGIAKANGIKITAKRVAFGGYKLRKYTSSKTKAGKKFRKALKKKYDYVVIQGHSEEFITTYNKHSYKSISKVIDMVKASGAEPILYMTWTQTTGITYSERGEEISMTREEMTQQVADIYNRLGNEFDVKVAPVGLNIMRCATEYPEIKLIRSDNKHPKYAGSYLAACTIYQTIFDRSVLGTKYYNTDEKKVGIGKTKAEKLQMIADVRLQVDKHNIYISPDEKTSVKASIVVSDNNTKYKELFSGGDTITYISLNPDIANVNKETGEIKALNPGVAYIRAQSDSGLSTITTVDVKSRDTYDLTLSERESVSGDSYKDNVLKWTNNFTDSKVEIYRSIYNKNHFKKIGETCKDYYYDKSLLKDKKYIYMIRLYSYVDGEYRYVGESVTRY